MIGVSQIPTSINMHAPGLRFESYATAGYYRNIEGKELWRLRKAIEQALATIQRIKLEGTRLLARCTVLRTAQWALDARRTRPSIPDFRDRLSIFADEVIDKRQGLSRPASKLHHGTAPSGD